MRESGRIFGMLNGLHIWGEYIRGLICGGRINGILQDLFIDKKSPRRWHYDYRKSAI